MFTRRNRREQVLQAERKLTPEELVAKAERYAAVIDLIEGAAERIGLPQQMRRALVNMAQKQIYRTLERFITENL